MTPEQQQIAIAEACGWIKCGCGDPECGAWFAPKSSPDDPSLGVPNYTDSLDAMAEAEEVLDNDLKTDYIRFLNKNDFSFRRAVFSTAAQRAEAFLKTIGEWEE